MRGVGRMSPIPWNLVVRGGSGVHSNFFGYRMRTRRDVALFERLASPILQLMGVKSVEFMSST